MVGRGEASLRNTHFGVASAPRLAAIMPSDSLIEPVLSALHRCGVPWVTSDQISVSMSAAGELTVEAVVKHSSREGGRAIMSTVMTGDQCFAPAVQEELLRLGQDELVRSVSTPNLHHIITIGYGYVRLSIDVEWTITLLMICTFAYWLHLSRHGDYIRGVMLPCFRSCAMGLRNISQSGFARFYDESEQRNVSETDSSLAAGAVTASKYRAPNGVPSAPAAADAVVPNSVAAEALMPDAVVTKHSAESSMLKRVEERRPGELGSVEARNFLASTFPTTVETVTEVPHDYWDTPTIDEVVTEQSKRVAAGAQDSSPSEPKRASDSSQSHHSPSPRSRRLARSARSTRSSTRLQLPPPKSPHYYKPAHGIWQVPDGYESLPPSSSDRMSSRTPLSPASSRKVVPRLSPIVSARGNSTSTAKNSNAPSEIPADVEAGVVDESKSRTPASSSHDDAGWFWNVFSWPFSSPVDVAPPQDAEVSGTGSVILRTPTSTYRGSEIETFIESRRLKAYLDVEAARTGDDSQARLQGKLVTFQRKVEGSTGGDDSGPATGGDKSSRIYGSQRLARNQSKEWTRLFLQPRVYS